MICTRHSKIHIARSARHLLVATSLALTAALVGGATLGPLTAPTARASSVSAPFDPSEFNSHANLAACGGAGGYWNWNFCNDPAVVGCPVFRNGTCGEYGIDIGLPAGTPIQAPESGTISTDGPCTPPNYSCWVPGRVRLSADSGDLYPGVMGFGHVNFVVKSGQHVTAGDEIATVADQSLYGTGWSNHVEFMYSPSGSLTQSAFTGGCSAPAYPCGEAPSNPNSPWSVIVALETGNGPSVTRGVVLRSNGTSGYVLDVYGGIHEFGGAPPVIPSATWPGSDITRGIVLRADGQSGYVLDLHGGIHPFGGAPPIGGISQANGNYWPNSDITRGIALRADGQSGYVLDLYGGIHPFGGAPNVTGSPYWQGSDVARSIALSPGATTSTVSGVYVNVYGGVGNFSS